jgi:hypothetical protein
MSRDCRHAWKHGYPIKKNEMQCNGEKNKIKVTEKRERKERKKEN